jgi:hypothetical protein
MLIFARANWGLFVFVHSGGLELLFNKKKRFDLEFDKEVSMQDLILWIRDKECKERPELFVIDNNM